MISSHYCHATIHTHTKVLPRNRFSNLECVHGMIPRARHICPPAILTPAQRPHEGTSVAACVSSLSLRASTVGSDPPVDLVGDDGADNVGDRTAPVLATSWAAESHAEDHSGPHTARANSSTSTSPSARLKNNTLFISSRPINS